MVLVIVLVIVLTAVASGDGYLCVTNGTTLIGPGGGSGGSPPLCGYITRTNGTTVIGGGGGSGSAGDGVLAVTNGVTVIGPGPTSGNDPVFNSVTHVYHLGEASGNARADSVGSLTFNESGGAIASAVGIHGDCLDLTASGLKKLVTSASRMTDVWTLAFWVKVHDSSLAAPSTWFRFGGGSGVIEADFGNSSPYPFETFYTANGGGNGSDNLNSLDAWHLVVIVEDQVSQGLQQSIDGSSFDLIFSGSDPLQDGDNPFSLGDGVASAGIYYDEVTIWNIALTQGNVTTLWNSGSGIFYSP